MEFSYISVLANFSLHVNFVLIYRLIINQRLSFENNDEREIEKSEFTIATRERKEWKILKGGEN